MPDPYTLTELPGAYTELGTYINQHNLSYRDSERFKTLLSRIKATFEAMAADAETTRNNIVCALASVDCRGSLQAALEHIDAARKGTP